MAGYTYEIRLRDMMSRGFQKASAAASKFYNNLNKNTKTFEANSKRVPRNIEQLETRLNSLRYAQSRAFKTKDISKFGRKVRQTERELRKLKSLPPLSMSERFRKLKTQLGGVIGLAGGLAIGLAAFGAVKGVVKLGSELEQTRISFQTMLGSVKAGNSMIADLDKFANVTPFGNADLQDSAKMLLNFGVNAKAIIPTLQRIGDVSGGNKEKLKGLTLAFSQVSSAGKLQGQDLLQMINQGFNPLQEIARTTGTSMATLRKRMSKGAISARMVENAFISATGAGGMFNGMMAKQAQTMGGKWSTMVGTFQSSMAKLGESLAPVISKVLDLGIFLTNNLAVIGPSIAIVGGMIGVVKMWTFAQKFLNIALINNPIGWIVMGIGVLIGVIVAVKSRTEGWGKSFSAVGIIIKTAAVMMWESLKHNFSMIGFAVNKLWLKFKQLGQWIGQLFKNVGKAISLAMVLDFSGAKKALSAPITTAASQEIEDLENKKKAASNKYLQIQIANAQKIAKAKAQFGIKWKSKEATTKIAAKANPNSAGGTNFATSANGSGSSNTANSIVTGGRKSVVLNVQIDKVVETIEQHISEGADSANELVDEVLDILTRRLHGTFKTVAS